MTNKVKFLIASVVFSTVALFGFQRCDVFAGHHANFHKLEELFEQPSDTEPSTNSPEKNRAILKAMMAMITNGHFSPKELDDKYSEEVFDKFFEYLDFNKQIFTAKDMEQFRKYRTKLDDEIKDNKIDFFEMVMKVYYQRAKETKAYYDKWIATSQAFDKDETIMLDGKKLAWAKNEKELEDRWRMNIKYRTLVRFVELQDAQNSAKDTVKDYKVLTDEQLADSSRKSVQRNLDYFFRRLNKNTDNEYFSMYCNAIAGNQDPHTDFMPPRDKQRFDEQMSGTFVGIGAVLRVVDGQCQIQQILAGTPCWKQGSLKVDDVILRVGQGEEEAVDVNGWDVEDIVKIIRGKKGTEVRLHVKHKDGKTEIIPIIRDEVKTEDVFAKSAVIQSGDKKIGYIYLPEFYADFQRANGKRCSVDMRKEVEKLVNDEKIDGLVLDLRWNGGGSLSDVVDITTLFVKDAASVQVKTTNSKPEVLANKTRGLLYEGPMTVLVNSSSASASEILAGALQDYKRAVIVGGTTHGKGTVQRIFSLDEFARKNNGLIPDLDTYLQNDGSLGSLKLTVQKFYRINGSSTQLNGVVPDILVPDVYMYMESGERRYESALPFDNIPTASYTARSNASDIEKAIANSKKRIAASAYFKLVEARAKQLKQQQDDNSYSLNITKYRKQLEEMRQLNKAIEDLDKEGTLLDVYNCRADMDRVLQDDASKKKNEDWLKGIKKDATLREAVNIVQDIINA